MLHYSCPISQSSFAVPCKKITKKRRTKYWIFDSCFPALGMMSSLWLIAAAFPTGLSVPVYPKTVLSNGVLAPWRCYDVGKFNANGEAQIGLKPPPTEGKVWGFVVFFLFPECTCQGQKGRQKNQVGFVKKTTLRMLTPSLSRR